MFAVRNRTHVGTLVPVRAYVGVTDMDWYTFLAARSDLGEVNFWRPGGDRHFGALTLGTILF